jgi:antitoxin ParD1/3/4
MARSIISISLPKWMGEYVQAEISEGGYDSVSEYFRELIRDYRQKKLSERKQEATLRRYKTEQERLELYGFHRPGEACHDHAFRSVRRDGNTGLTPRDQPL